jgi:peptide/nickel transport system substrate-binding protein
MRTARQAADGRAAQLLPFVAGLALALSACRGSDSARPVIVDLVGRTGELVNPIRFDGEVAAQAALAATAQGLVSFDAQGEVTGALAESWIVSDGGQSYIFRLRRAKWTHGGPVKADIVARLLQERMHASPDLLAGLKPEVRAMTDRVIEIRLETALPAFIQLLAQPRLAILGKEGGTGPYISEMRLRRLYLSPMPDTAGGEDDGDAHDVLPIERRTLEADKASLSMARFQDGQTDLVLGGRFQDLLLIPATRLGANDVRADPAPGLFGFAIVGSSPFFADRSVRDSLSRVVDRARLAAGLNLQGWATATTPLPGELDIGRTPSLPEWSTAPIADRVASARTVINAWKAGHGAPPMLRIALPAGAGATLLFYRLAADFGTLGLRVDRVGMDEPADLRLIDEVAGFDSALWYLARLDCASGIACDPSASTFLDQARTADNPVQQSAMLAEAERLIVANAGFIPLGVPIRWSLVSRRLTGFAPSPRAVHPLNSLLPATN